MGLKILFVRFSSIGDIVLTSPVLRCWRKSRPNDELHYLTKSQFSFLLSENPNIDKVHELTAFSETLKNLKKEKFDLIVDLHKNLRTTRLSLSLGVKRITFNKLSWAKYLSVRKKDVSVLPDLHIVDRYFGACKNYIEDDGLGLDYFGEQKPQLFKELPSEYAVIVAGAAHPTKKIPEELLAKIQEKSKLPCIILGAKSDDNVAFNSMQNVVNLCGKTNLHESAYVVKSANHVYSSDTGLMHIAAAFQKEITVFWGNTVPEFGMYPFRTPHINKEVGGLSCRPCSKIGFPECPKGHFKCMMDQEV